MLELNVFSVFWCEKHLLKGFVSQFVGLFFSLSVRPTHFIYKFVKCKKDIREQVNIVLAWDISTFFASKWLCVWKSWRHRYAIQKQPDLGQRSIFFSDFFFAKWLLKSLLSNKVSHEGIPPFIVEVNIFAGVAIASGYWVTGENFFSLKYRDSHFKNWRSNYCPAWLHCEVPCFIGLLVLLFHKQEFYGNAILSNLCLLG